MTNKPHMTLPNGDVIHEGDYGLTRDGRVAGPMVRWSNAVVHPWEVRGYKDDLGGEIWRDNGVGYSNGCRDIIARAEPPQAAKPEPKKWRDMTDAEKGALLLAHHEGKVIEMWGGAIYGWKVTERPLFMDLAVYRIRPPRVSGTVEIGADGKPDFRTWEQT